MGSRAALHYKIRLILHLRMKNFLDTYSSIRQICKFQAALHVIMSRFSSQRYSGCWTFTKYTEKACSFRGELYGCLTYINDSSRKYDQRMLSRTEDFPFTGSLIGRESDRRHSVSALTSFSTPFRVSTNILSPRPSEACGALKMKFYRMSQACDVSNMNQIGGKGNVNRSRLKVAKDLPDSSYELIPPSQQKPSFRLNPLHIDLALNQRVYGPDNFW